MHLGYAFVVGTLECYMTGLGPPHLSIWAKSGHTVNCLQQITAVGTFGNISLRSTHTHATCRQSAVHHLALLPT